MPTRNGTAAAILVVEDDEDVRAVLQESLESEGHEVVASDFGLLPLGPFALILTDVPVWPYESDDARRWVRYLRDRYAGARIMLCTAQRAVHRELDGLGADGVLDMPFDLNELFARVSSLVRGPVARRRALFAASTG